MEGEMNPPADTNAEICGAVELGKDGVEKRNDATEAKTAGDQHREVGNLKRIRSDNRLIFFFFEVSFCLQM
jgi:hypothetical protein